MITLVISILIAILLVGLVHIIASRFLDAWFVQILDLILVIVLLVYLLQGGLPLR